jgi:MT0933-like antitoxin protein
MPDFGELANKAKDLAGEHQDQVQDGVEKAEDMAKDKLGGKFGGQVDQGGDAVENFLGVDDQTDEQGNEQR